MKNFYESVVKQRERIKLTKEEVKARIEKAPYGSKAKELIKRWSEVESYGCSSLGIFTVTPMIVRAKGVYLYDDDDKEYIDLLSGFSVSNLGHCNEKISEIIKSQADKLVHFFDFPHEERVKLSEKLTALSKIKGKTRVMYGVSGSEGIELAVRAIRYFTGQPYILTAYGDYHGHTYGVKGLTGKGNLQVYYYPNQPNTCSGYFHFPYCYRCPYNEKYPECDMFCMKSFEKLLDGKETPFGSGVNNISNVGGILVENYQSSAGYIISPDEYLQELRRIADKFGFILAIDEIQAGIGRTGKLWSFEHSGIEPDMFISSKSLGGGLPLAAVVAKSEILTEWGPGAHVSTQAGNVIACAAGNYVLQEISSKEFLDKVNEKGKYLADGLGELEKKYKLIGYFNTKGLYTGIELVKDRKTKEPASEATAYIRERCLEEGVLFEHGGYFSNRMQLIPSLTIKKAEIDKVIATLEKVFREAEGKFINS
jgi:4-aminobutyrate aminotransferase-like enzyme